MAIHAQIRSNKNTKMRKTQNFMTYSVLDFQFQWLCEIKCNQIKLDDPIKIVVAFPKLPSVF